jgi:hypothetical protein
MHISITTNNSYQEEKDYIFYCIFSYFWSIDYEVYYTSDLVGKYKITCGKSTIEIPDCFFELGKNFWLNKESLPVLPLQAFSSSFESLSSFSGLSILYGRALEETWYSRSDSDQYLGIDIFGSAFFMLSRYEEYMDFPTDSHGRFQYQHSVAGKADLIETPIINEYLDLFWSCIQQLDPTAKRKERNYSVNISHDIDRPIFYESDQHEIRLKLYERIMTALEQRELRSTWNFMTDITNPEIDVSYSLEDEPIRSLFCELHRRGHQIGLHPSYETFKDASQLSKEKSMLQDTCEELGITQNITSGRQHYLRFKTPDTWQHYIQSGLSSDATLGYSSRVGFRSGICYDYPVFDIANKQSLPLIESPLIVMDVTLFCPTYMDLPIDSQAILDKVKEMADLCKKHEGEFNILFHDNYLAEEKFFTFFESALDQIIFS